VENNVQNESCAMSHSKATLKFSVYDFENHGHSEKEQLVKVEGQ